MNIIFQSINYKADTKLKNWLDDALNTFDEIYGHNRPGFIDGYIKLKNSITSW